MRLSERAALLDDEGLRLRVKIASLQVATLVIGSETATAEEKYHARQLINQTENFVPLYAQAAAALPTPILTAVLEDTEAGDQVLLDSTLSFVFPSFVPAAPAAGPTMEQP